jgi:hypothetical protein
LTALNYILARDRIVVSTDTLRSSGEGEPHGFVSKILPLPHLHGVVCGTGSLDLLVDWYAFVQRRVGALDMRDLDDLAARQLPALAVKYPRATIYHFGLDAMARRSEDRRKGPCLRNVDERTTGSRSPATGCRTRRNRRRNAHPNPNGIKANVMDLLRPPSFRGRLESNSNECRPRLRITRPQSSFSDSASTYMRAVPRVHSREYACLQIPMSLP